MFKHGDTVRVRPAALGSALCHGCMDAEYWARRDATEGRDE